MPEVYREPQIVVYESNTTISNDENKHAIKKLRSVLPDYISLVVFSEEIGPLKEWISTGNKTIRIVEQDNFFLDNLFGVISAELKNQSVYYHM